MILFWKIDFGAKKTIVKFSTKLHLNLKISTCYSSPMFCANVLFHCTSFDPKSSLAGNMALTIDMPLNIENHGLLFTFITHTKSSKGKIQKPYDITT